MLYERVGDRHGRLIFVLLTGSTNIQQPDVGKQTPMTVVATFPDSVESVALRILTDRETPYNAADPDVTGAATVSRHTCDRRRAADQTFPFVRKKAFGLDTSAHLLAVTSSAMEFCLSAAPMMECMAVMSHHHKRHAAGAAWRSHTTPHVVQRRRGPSFWNGIGYRNAPRPRPGLAPLRCVPNDLQNRIWYLQGTVFRRR